MKTNKEQLLEMISGICDINLTFDSSKDIDIFNDLAIDSVGFIRIIIEIESRYNIQIPNDMLVYSYFRTISQIEEIINTLIDKKSTGDSNE